MIKKRSNEQSISDAVDRLIDAYGMREKMDELDITAQWDKTVGAMVARHTVAVRLKKGKLIVKVDSAPLRQELTYMRDALAEVLNQRAGRDVVKEIILE